MWESFMRFASLHPVLAAVAIILISFAAIPIVLFVWHLTDFSKLGRTVSSEQLQAIKKRSAQKPHRILSFPVRAVNPESSDSSVKPGNDIERRSV